MESMLFALNGIKTEGKSGYTASRDAIRPMGNSIHKPFGLE